MLLLLVLGKLTNSTFRLWYRYVITPTYELDAIHALTLVYLNRHRNEGITELHNRYSYGCNHLSIFIYLLNPVSNVWLNISAAVDN